MMPTVLVTHPAGLDHDTGPYHPESPDRLRHVLAALNDPEFADLLRLDAPEADIAALARVHDDRYIADILAVRPPRGTRIALDGDTLMSAGSAEAASRAAGGAMLAVDMVMEGRAGHAFVAMRPPGHHAERARAMGFCFFASAAVAARHAQAKWGIGRVAIVDFDVHHGNGTQDAAWDDPTIFYASSHQSPCFPGTGAARETGAHHNVVNTPLPPGAGSEAFRAAWAGTILPALDAFAPELLIVSAGFDGHAADPLAQLRLDETDFAWITARLVAAARQHCGGRLVSILEGGYDLDALASSAATHVRGLLQN